MSLVQVETESLSLIASALAAVKDQISAVETALGSGDQTRIDSETAALDLMEDGLTTVVSNSIIRTVGENVVLEAGSAPDKLYFSSFEFLGEQIAQIEVNFSMLVESHTALTAVHLPGNGRKQWRDAERDNRVGRRDDRGRWRGCGLSVGQLGTPGLDKSVNIDRRCHHGIHPDHHNTAVSGQPEQFKVERGHHVQQRDP